MKDKPQIIIIDDEPDLTANLRDIMYGEGYPVQIAHNGQSGIALCGEGDFDLAFIDVRLPDMSGNDVAKKIVALSPKTECILITAYASLDSAIDAVKQEGVVAYEIKPLDMDHVLRLVKEIFRRKQAEGEREKLEAQFQMAQRMESIGILAGGIAHDFNNLLMGIQGNASLMLLDIDTGHPHYERLRNVERDIQKGAELTGQLLGFAGNGRYEVIPTKIKELVKKSSEMFGRTRKEIRIHTRCMKDIGTVEVDRGQIEQVFLNLFINASQAMPKGGDIYLETKNVTLDATRVKPFEAKMGDYVMISITDTGVGMDERVRQRIFEPFFTTKEMGRGTGLGLASAYGIIKNHGGIINVHSAVGQGTTFEIYLPISQNEAVEVKKHAGRILKGAETILFVDDEDMIVDVSGEALKALGYNVLIAGSGNKAIEIYKENSERIGMVMLDMIMPGMGGGEVFDRLKEINPHVKVLLSSGYTIDGQAAEILKRGCTGFIQKPFNLKELSGKVREILDCE